jgi:hypothetical protein
MQVQLGIELNRSGQRGLANEVLTRALRGLEPPATLHADLAKAFRRIYSDEYRKVLRFTRPAIRWHT